jgi:hypothetical protein
VPVKANIAVVRTIAFTTHLPGGEGDSLRCPTSPTPEAVGGFAGNEMSVPSAVAIVLSFQLVHRGEAYRAHQEDPRRVSPWTGLGYWRTRSNHSNYSDHTNPFRAEFIAPGC